MITKTAWKNIWRNRVRSIVVMVSVAIGIFAGIFSVAVMNGAIGQRLDAALNDEISHIQITSKNFRANNDLDCFMQGTDAMRQKLLSLSNVEAVAERLVVVGMANSATKSAGVQIEGVYPEQERLVTGLPKRLKAGTGSYLEKDDRTNYAYIGVDLAKELNIIRYELSGEIIDSLKNTEIPASIVEKLEPFRDKRFKNEKLFKKGLSSVLSPEEVSKYGPELKELAQNFRRRAKITLTFIDKDNNQTGAVFRIVGLYDISNNMFEGTQVFVMNETLRRLISFPGDANHELLVKLNDVSNTDSAQETIKSLYPDLDVLSWKEISPDLSMMEQMASMMYGVFMAVILAALAFGIVNTMLMVVLERTKELGMLTAIGMNKKKVFRMIMTESVFLSISGGIVGMIISYIVIALVSRNGINFSSYQEGFEAMGYSSHIYPEIGMGFFLITSLLIIITGILSSIYPARRALKLNPADALRTE